jgi:hypothetical protein
MELPKSMTVDLGIQGSSISTFVGSNRLKSMVWEDSWGCLLALPWINDMEWPHGASGDATWRRPTWSCGPTAPYHVHLPPIHLFLYIFCEISCIQIYFPVQVELGEIISKFSTCDDDLPYFILLFGEILMVLMGASDHQQPS